MPARGRRAPRGRRTLSVSRFREYRSLLRAALSHGYAVVSLEAFLRGDARDAERVLILRHDVDRHPRSALTMVDMEADLGVRSTWYLRWRTADPGIIATLRDAGGEVGLHYETLTRRVRADGLEPGADIAPLLEPCRAELREEIAAFGALFGPCQSVCAHGDTRVPGVRNLTLLEREDLSAYGVRFDANLALRRHAIAIWLTDRSLAEGGWNEGHEPLKQLERAATPILCLTHPNNWVGSVGLWLDRGLAAGLPSPAPGARARIRRSRSDRPART